MQRADASRLADRIAAGLELVDRLDLGRVRARLDQIAAVARAA